MKLISNCFLSLLTFAALFVLLELGFRAKAYIEDTETFAKVFSNRFDLPEPEHPAKLAHIIQPSTNSRIIYELRPNVDVEFFELGKYVTTNSAGFRGPSVPFEKGSSYRILGIGDSFMFGQGVADGEEYLYRLKEELQDKFPVEIINTAVPGYNTVMEVETLKEKGLKYRPDLVIIEFVGNDILLPNFIKRKAPVFSLSKSFSLDFFAQRSKRLEDQLPAALRALNAHGIEPASKGKELHDFEGDPELVPKQYKDMVGWEGYSRAMRELRELEKEHGFTVLVIALDPERDPGHIKALELSKELGFWVVNIGEYFKNYMDEHGIEHYVGSGLSVSKHDGHPSAAGHSLYAKRLAEVISEFYAARVENPFSSKSSVH